MTKKSILEKNIEQLELNSKILNILKENNINIVEDLWKLKRKNLKDFGLTDNDIEQIIIKMQLHAIDLNKKMY